MAWRRQWCHLCELPKPPWAVVGDFSQAVCRGCANFEGAGRVELLLAAARHLRGHHVSPSVPKELGEALYAQHDLQGHHEATKLALSPSVPKELGEALYTQHDLQGHHEATSLALSPSVPKELGEALYTERHLWGHHVSPSVPKELREALYTQHDLQGHHEATRLALSPSVPKELREALDTEHRLWGHQVSPSVPKELREALCGHITSESSRGHHEATRLALSPSVPKELGEALYTERCLWGHQVSPSVPTELREALDTEHHVRGHHMSPSVPKELREAFYSEHHLRGHHEATRLPLSPSVPKELREASDTERHLRGHHEATRLAVSPSVPTELSLCGRVPSKRRHHRDVTVPLDVSPSVPMELSRHHGTRAVSPSVPMELSRHHATRAVSPSVPTELSDALCGRITSEGTDRRHHATTRAVSPAVPAALQRHRAVSPAMSPAVPAALSAALAEAWPGKPRAVRERLSVLAGCAPFAVRLRRDHALVGRVLAFDAAPRAGPDGSGGDFELRLFAEYPCGSGSVYGALGLARRMFQDCPRAPGRSISSGYKYLEYEKRQGSGEWRLLAELFTESVRLFRRPPSPEALPQQQQQRCHLSLSPLSPPPARRRRKACPESRVVAGEALSCGRCRRLLEDTHFVQCPAVPRHRFCFPCARRAIRARGPGGAVHCPSGGRCPLAASGLPWAFMQGEIAAILAGDVRVKRERDP